MIHVALEILGYDYPIRFQSGVGRRNSLNPTFSNPPRVLKLNTRREPIWLSGFLKRSFLFCFC
jgi:hypothetical protein